MLTTVALLLATAGAAQCPVSASRPDTLRVATYAYPNVDRRASVGGIADYLSRALRLPARVDVHADPIALADALRAGDAHVGVINLFGYLQLSFDSTVVTPAVTFRVPASAVPYEAAIAARAPLTAEGLRARAGALRLAFVSPGSTTGNLFPRLYLASLGIRDAESTFQKVRYAGTHARAFELLRSGEADVVALAGEELDKQLAATNGAAGIRTLWRSGNLPLGPVMLSCRLGDDMRSRITSRLAELHRADTAAFSALKRGWVEARDADALVAVAPTTYRSLRQMLGDPAAARRMLERPTVIQGASVLDGSGAPARVANVRIVQGRVASVGTESPQAGDSVIDARGLTLAPGFIDSHSHHDRGLRDNRDALAAVSQGITTIVVGQDGGSQLPLRQLFARLDSQPVAVNVASYVGHGTLRRRVMGDDYRRVATAAEVARMRELLLEEMAAGALGLSTGLEYDPGIYSARDEVLALAKAIAPLGGRYISHIRSEDREFWQALDELLVIGREARIPVQVSHMKLAMRALWGQGDKLIATLDSARKAGINVTADVYPWTMWQSTLTVLYPKRNFDDRAETDFILTQVAAPEDLVLGAYELQPSYVGKNVGEIAALRGSDPATTLMALIAESRAKNADESVIARGMDDRDIDRLYRWPWTSVSSDGELNGRHPRGFGSFPRVLGRYVRERNVLSLAEAVRRMTSLPAASLGLPRGKLEPGAVADLVLFDPATVSDRATMQSPRALSVGIRTVWVSGRVVYDNGRTTGATPGIALRR